MEFGVLFTSQPDTETEKYPYQSLHERVTAEVVGAESLGYDCAWIAEHHFSTGYGVMPDVFVYAANLAAMTKRIKIGTAVVTLPLSNPIRAVENANFIDILSNARFRLGVGSGYRPYEFEGFGLDFEARREVQEEAIQLMLELFHNRRVRHVGKHFRSIIEGEYELLPQGLQTPHPPLFMAGATDRSIGYAGSVGFGLLLSTLTPVETLGQQVATYREALGKAPERARSNPSFGHVDIARWVYVAETDEAAKRESEAGLLRHLSHYFGGQTAGYLGETSKGKGALKDDLNYDSLLEATILHGSPDTVAAQLRRLQEHTDLNSLMLHYPPWYGTEKSRRSLKLFAEHVMPQFRGKGGSRQHSA